MTDPKTATFYFCDLKSKNIECPKMNECKRYVPVKDLPFAELEQLGAAKLYNICNEKNKYKLFMRLDKDEINNDTPTQ